MIKRSMLLGTAALVLVALGAGNRPAEACWKCTISQQCVDGPYGSSCTMYEEGGRQYCQHTLDCEGMTLTPLDVSAAGTYMAGSGVQVTEGALRKQQCNGYVVSHLAGGDAGRATVQTIRI